MVTGPWYSDLYIYIYTYIYIYIFFFIFFSFLFFLFALHIWLFRDKKPVMESFRIPFFRSLFFFFFFPAFLWFFFLFHESCTNRLQRCLMTVGCLVCLRLWDRNPPVCVCPVSGSSFFFLFCHFCLVLVNNAFITCS